MEPRIELKTLNLAGMEIKIDFSNDTDAKLMSLQNEFMSELKKVIKNDKKVSYIAYWYYKQNDSNKTLYDCYYLAGVEKKNILSMPDKFISIDLPKSLFAIFKEDRRGVVGGPEGYAYKTWLPDSGYELNHNIMGDLEMYPNIEDIGPDNACEILIPITIG